MRRILRATLTRPPRLAGSQAGPATLGCPMRSALTSQPRQAAALAWAAQRWQPSTRAAFVRRPDADAHAPQHQDLDLVIFGRVDIFRPERHVAPDGTPVDLAWYPAPLLDDPARIARSGLAAHRIAAADLAWRAADVTGDAANDCTRQVRHLMRRPDVRADRLAVFLDMGRLTVRETGVTGDLPCLARFWLQMGHGGIIAALADLHDRVCPNVYTRPFGVLKSLGKHRAAPIANALGLHDDAAAVARVLRAMHSLVAQQFSTPPWPAAMREATRAEYAYTLDAAELEWRLAVAGEMQACGQGAAAIWYLRYWAYALARLPMVWHAAARGDDIAFLRPERPVRAALAQQCPALLPLLERALGGPLELPALQAPMDSLRRLRQEVLARCNALSLPLRDIADWQPYRAAA